MIMMETLSIEFVVIKSNYKMKKRGYDGLQACLDSLLLLCREYKLHTGGLKPSLFFLKIYGQVAQKTLVHWGVPVIYLFCSGIHGHLITWIDRPLAMGK